MKIQTPYYLIDKNRLCRNLETIQFVREKSGVKVLLALKCFATWSVFELMRPYMNGTTSSSLYEAQLGRQKFGGETHAYSVAFADHEIEAVIASADKITFNSMSQLQRFAPLAAPLSIGLRLNPGVSFSHFDLADPARACSRLGEWDLQNIEQALDCIDGVLIHNHCENADFNAFDTILSQIEEKFAAVLTQVKWVNLGGGVAFTKPGYPLDDFCARLKAFSERFEVEVYLEPGEAVVADSTTLEVTVLDTLFNGKSLAIVDSSIEAHMLDLLVYRQHAEIDAPGGAYPYIICGKSCLAGDVFGEAAFNQVLKPGDRLSIRNAAGYTMVKKNWFNGVQMPSIVMNEGGDNPRQLLREFSFEDYLSSLS